MPIDSEVQVQLNRIISDIESEKGSRARAHSRLAEQIREIEHRFEVAIFGNGASKGIKTEVFLLNQSIDNINKTIENTKIVRRLFIASAIGAFFTTIVNLIFFTLTYFSK